MENLVQDPDHQRDVANLIISSVEPLVHSINDALEAILLTMHNEDFDISEFDPEKTSSGSPYMRELQSFVSRVNLDFLSKFTCKNMVAESCLPLVVKNIDFFILQASLVRPLSHAGQKKLVQDGKLIQVLRA